MCEKELLSILADITKIVEITPNDTELGAKMREFFERKRMSSYINKDNRHYDNDNEWGKVSGY